MTMWPPLILFSSTVEIFAEIWAQVFFSLIGGWSDGQCLFASFWHSGLRSCQMLPRGFVHQPTVGPSRWFGSGIWVLVGPHGWHVLFSEVALMRCAIWWGYHVVGGLRKMIHLMSQSCDTLWLCFVTALLVLEVVSCLVVRCYDKDVGGLSPHHKGWLEHAVWSCDAATMCRQCLSHHCEVKWFEGSRVAMLWQVMKLVIIQSQDILKISISCLWSCDVVCDVSFVASLWFKAVSPSGLRGHDSFESHRHMSPQQLNSLACDLVISSCCTVTGLISLGGWLCLGGLCSHKDKNPLTPPSWHIKYFLTLTCLHDMNIVLSRWWHGDGMLLKIWCMPLLQLDFWLLKMASWWIIDEST